jgi:hypothetical protein
MIERVAACDRTARAGLERLELEGPVTAFSRPLEHMRCVNEAPRAPVVIRALTHRSPLALRRTPIECGSYVGQEQEWGGRAQSRRRLASGAPGSF